MILEQSAADGVSRNSWLHRWPAGLKLLILVVMATGFVLVTNPWVLSVSALAMLFVWLSAVGRIDWQSWKKAVWLAVTIAVLVAYVAFFNGTDQAIVVLFRLLAMLLASLAVMASTPISAMMGALEQALAPLGRRGWIDPQKVALAFGLSVRMVPVLIEQWQEIREAQAARGASAWPHALLVPMLARTIRRADEIAEAIDVRSEL
jgi:biotin transport system permease protein